MLREKNEVKYLSLWLKNDANIYIIFEKTNFFDKNITFF